MTDDEKHSWCHERGYPSAVFLPESLYRIAERQGYDMRYYVITKPIPIINMVRNSDEGSP